MNQYNTDTTQFSLKAEITKIRALPREKRWEYIWDYYKMAILGTLFAAFLLWSLGSFLVNLAIGTLFPKEPVSMAFAATDFANNEAWMEQCLTAIGYDESQEKFQAMSTSPHNDTRDDFRITTTVWFANGQPDIFIVDEPSYQYLQELGVLVNLRETWPENLQQLADTRMDGPFGLEISNTALAHAYGISGEPIYLCMVTGSAGYDRALDIVEYILTEN